MDNPVHCPGMKLRSNVMHLSPCTGNEVRKDGIHNRSVVAMESRNDGMDDVQIKESSTLSRARPVLNTPLLVWSIGLPAAPY